MFKIKLRIFPTLFLILCILPFGNEECHDVASSQKHNYIPEPSLPYKNVKPIVVVFVQ